MNDDEVQMILHRTARGAERAAGYWRAGGPRVLFMYEIRLLLKRAIKLWWHGKRTKALTDRH